MPPATDLRQKSTYMSANEGLEAGVSVPEAENLPFPDGPPWAPDRGTHTDQRDKPAAPATEKCS